MKIFAVSIVFIVSLILSPILYYVIRNNYLLWNFSEQVADGDYIPAHYRKRLDLIASGSRVGHGLSNGENCFFSAAAIYKSYLSDNEVEELSGFIKRRVFSPLIFSYDHSMQSQAILAEGLVVIWIQDGPISAGFDPRCW